MNVTFKQIMTGLRQKVRSTEISCDSTKHPTHRPPRRQYNRYEEQKGLAVKRSAGVALGLNLRECVTHTPPPSANNTAHSGFKTQRRYHQKSKIRISMAQQKVGQKSKNTLSYNLCFITIEFSTMGCRWIPWIWWRDKIIVVKRILSRDLCS